MKQTQSCLKCQATKIFVVDEVHRRHEIDSGVSVVPVTVTAAHVTMRATGVFGESNEPTIVEAGRYEAWICARCGYTEWYATRLEELAVVAATSSAVRVIERDVVGGPYRT
jgi:predicted nucleic-acid-binding Zn-ribbon protein